LKKHIETDTPWGKKLTAEKAKRALSANLDTEEAAYSPVHFKMESVCAILKECISEQRTNQDHVLLEGMCNHKLLAGEDDQMQVRYMDEFFALEELVAKVGAVINLGYDIEKELIEEVKVDPKQDEERKAALAAKERERRDKAKAAADGEEEPPAEEEGAVKNSDFEPLMFNWSESNKQPKNLAQLFYGVKGGNFVPEKKQWNEYAEDGAEADGKVIAAALDDFCKKIDALDDADKCWYVQVKFPQP
jgi:hypothetical protein